MTAYIFNNTNDDKFFFVNLLYLCVSITTNVAYVSAANEMKICQVQSRDLFVFSWLSIAEGLL